MLYRITLALAIVATSALSADWPQWQGPRRDNISQETGLLKKWPDGGPKKLWSFQGLGKGYAAPIVVEGCIFITGSADEQEILFSLDSSGRKAWQTTYGPMWTKNFPSARTTPTFRDGRLYLVSSLAKAVCFEAANGKIVWEVDMKDRFDARDITWGINESPLVVGDRVICTPGGEKAPMVALSLKDGATIWTMKELSDKSAYCSPQLVKCGSRSLAVTALSDHIVGVDIADGKLLWSHPYKGRCRAHINTPIYSDGIVFFTSGYDDGGVALKLGANGESVAKLYETKTLDTHHGGLVLLDGHLYGSNWINNRKGNWICMELATGDIKYDTAWECKGAITSAEGMLYCYEEKKGNVALVKATPSGFDPLGTFRVNEGEGQHWAHPVIADGRLYLRHGDVLMCHDIRAAGR